MKPRRRTVATSHGRLSGSRIPPTTRAPEGPPKAASFARVSSLRLISRGRLALYAAARMGSFVDGVRRMRLGEKRNRSQRKVTVLCVGADSAAPRAPAKHPIPASLGFRGPSRRALQGNTARGGAFPSGAFLFSWVSMHISVRVYS